MTSEYRVNYIALATKHWKEDAIAPPFREHLGATLITPWIDTDELGTFSGEIARKGSALDIALLKARLGMHFSRLPYGLASEGSFGSHPFLPFLPCDTEVIVYIDDERGFTLHEALTTENTNYAHASVDTLEQARSFLASAHFPSHGVIVRPNNWQDRSLIYKQIATYAEFEHAFATSKAASDDGKVWLETDMRAFYNPTRMKVIGEVAERLAKRLATPCPACHAPGWGGVRVEKGLPCNWCGKPTELIKQEVLGCVQCPYEAVRRHRESLTTTGPENCPRCNSLSLSLNTPSLSED